jgi:OOP family OmpA-OmpF porin
MTSAIPNLNVQTGRPSANRRQPWKVISFVASVAILSMQAAHAQNTGWYAGANAGATNAKQTDGGLNGAFANQGITADTSLDKRDSIYSLDLGYQFHRNFAVEGSYVDLGKYNFNSNISTPAADTASGNYRVKGWTASAVGILPLDNGFSAYGKLGAVFADTKFNASSDTGATAIGDTSKSSTRPLYGLGLGYDFTKQIVGKAEWTRYDGLGNSDTGKSNIDTYTVGVAYKF